MNAAYMRCPDCHGYGVVETPGPGVQTCGPCLGTGEVRARDGQGRYTGHEADCNSRHYLGTCDCKRTSTS